jgi:putative transposase
MRLAFADEQMVAIVREADREPVADVAKRHGVSKQTIYVWRKQGYRIWRMRAARNALSHPALLIFLRPRPEGEPLRHVRRLVVSKRRRREGKPQARLRWMLKWSARNPACGSEKGRRTSRHPRPQ